MKILCLTDFPVRPPDRWLWDYLPGQPDEVDFLWAGATDRSASWGKLVTRYPAYARLASQALSQLNTKHYDVVVAWEASVGIPFALAARLRRRGVPPIVLLAFNPGDVPVIFQPLIGLGLQNAAHCAVLTPTEVAAYSRRYAIPAARMSVNPCPATIYTANFSGWLGRLLSAARPISTPAADRAATTRPCSRRSQVWMSKRLSTAEATTSAD